MNTTVQQGLISVSYLLKIFVKMLDFYILMVFIYINILEIMKIIKI